jgi:NAD(P)-dependent dehydrogenase (short-subunit alcohol dehydrogenase family)
MNLHGSKVVIIGAGSGIGRSIAVAMSQAGATLVLGGRTLQSLERTAESSSGTVEVRVLDAAVEEQVEGFFEEIGAFDHLVSTIGHGVTGPIRTLRADEIRRAMDAKLWAPLFLVKHGAPRIAANGSFTFFSGIRAARPNARSSVTSMVNGGLEAFAKAMAVELGPVRANVISPGIGDSGPFWDRLGAEERDRFFADFALRAPARRVGSPGDQASAVLFAIGNPFRTGTVLAVDGGALLM